MRTKHRAGAVHARQEVVSVEKRLQGLIDRRLVRAFCDIVAAALGGTRLQSASLGRHLPNAAPVRKRSERSGHRKGPLRDKDNIKRVDRFLGNERVHRSQFLLWKAVMAPLFRGAEQLIVLVDWTGGCAGSKLWTLSASIARAGRAYRVYETVVPEKKLDSPAVCRGFLDELKALLPVGVPVFIVTDAGFRRPFFKAVLAHGWDYVGRLRGRTFVGKPGERPSSAKVVLRAATQWPKLLSGLNVGQTKPLFCPTAVLWKAPPKGRVDKSRKGTKKRGNHADKYSKANREGWLLLSSATHLCARQLVRIYQQRMTHEEAFRDLKSPRFGLGLEQARTKNANRHALLCFIGAVVALILCRLGQATRRTDWAASLQANTVKDRLVLSDFTLGRLLIQSLVPRVSGLLAWARPDG